MSGKLHRILALSFILLGMSTFGSRAYANDPVYGTMEINNKVFKYVKVDLKDKTMGFYPATANNAEPNNSSGNASWSDGGRHLQTLSEIYNAWSPATTIAAINTDYFDCSWPEEIQHCTGAPEGEFVRNSHVYQINLNRTVMGILPWNESEGRYPVVFEKSDSEDDGYETAVSGSPIITINDNEDVVYNPDGLDVPRNEDDNMPRTAACVTKDNRWLYLVVTHGSTGTEMGEFFKAVDSKIGMEFDSSSSTTMIFNGEVKEKNWWSTTGPAERPIGAGLIVFKKNTACSNRCYVTALQEATLSPSAGCVSEGEQRSGIGGSGCYMCQAGAWTQIVCPGACNNQCYVTANQEATLSPDVGCVLEGVTRPGIGGNGCYLCKSGYWTEVGCPATCSNQCYVTVNQEATLSPDAGCASEGEKRSGIGGAGCYLCQSGNWIQTSCPVTCSNRCYVTGNQEATLSPDAGCAAEGVTRPGIGGSGCYLCQSSNWKEIACPGTCGNRCYVTANQEATLSPDEGCVLEGVTRPGIGGSGCYLCRSGNWAQTACPVTCSNRCYVTANQEATLSPDAGCVLEGVTRPGIGGSGCYLCQSGNWAECQTQSKVKITFEFESLPDWSSVEDANWGQSAGWSISNTGQVGRSMTANRNARGSSARVVHYSITPHSAYTISIYMKCGSSAADYWVESAFKLGSNSAYNFDSDPGTWIMLQKFSRTNNGNNDNWVIYSQTFNSGDYTTISVGYKIGSLDDYAPVAYWDSLKIE